MKTSDFDYNLPPELIAQEPLSERASARMLVVDRARGDLCHSTVRELPGFLSPGDLLVANETRVVPARLFGTRCDTGGKVEVLLVEPEAEGRWDAFFRASGRARVGMRAEFAGGELTAEILETRAEGRVSLSLRSSRPLETILAEHGVPPLPPYIKREAGVTSRTDADREHYQTVFARNDGAIAAPTAGLHFTPELLSSLADRGIDRTAITLHVGPGTFKPVKSDEVESHNMESERYIIGAECAEKMNSVDRTANRIVAVGSTTVRTCESVAAQYGRIQACEGRTSLFIYPPYEFKTIDAMLTNFHLPKSTLVMMVSALAGKDLIMQAYQEAVRERYRFYSYGDCMLIL